MSLKVLNAEHRIVAVDMPKRKKKGGICVCYSYHTDMIVINLDAYCLEKIAEIISLYMTLEDQKRLEAKNYSNGGAVQGILQLIDRVNRIRRHLHRHKGV